MWSSCRCLWKDLENKTQPDTGEYLPNQNIAGKADLFAGQWAAGELRQSGGTDAPVKVRGIQKEAAGRLDDHSLGMGLRSESRLLPMRTWV